MNLNLGCVDKHKLKWTRRRKSLPFPVIRLSCISPYSCSGVGIGMEGRRRRRKCDFLLLSLLTFLSLISSPCIVNGVILSNEVYPMDAGNGADGGKVNLN